MFEQFCELFIKRKTGGDVHRYGKRGEKQKGIDFYVDLPSGERWTYQCRRYQRFTLADAMRAHNEKTYSQSSKHFVVVACEVGAKVRDQFDRWTHWDVIDVRDLSNDVADMPLDDARRLLDTHFDAPFRREFLGLHGVSTFLPAAAFFATRPSDLLSHEVPLYGRDDILAKIPVLLSGDQHLALLTGPGGIGKSRLLKAIGERAENSVQVRYVAAGITFSPSAVDELPLAPLLLIVDDAHLRNDVKALLEIVKQRNLPTRMLLAGRPYYDAIASNILSLAGFSKDDLLIFDPVRPLSREETVALVRSLLPRGRERDVQLVAAVCRDAPLIAVVTCRLIQRRGLDLSRLSRDADIRFTVLERFRDELLGTVPGVDQKQAQSLIRLLAAIGPVNPEDRDIEAAILKFIGVARQAFVELLDLLVQSGLVRHRGHLARLVPEVLADHVLDDACLTRAGKATGYAQEVFHAFRGVAGPRLLRNLAEVDWRNRSGERTAGDVFSEIFSEIGREFDTAGMADRLQILGIVQEIAYFEPEHALFLVGKAMEAAAGDLSESDRHWRFNGGMLLGRLPEILRLVALHPQYLARAARLLWVLGRDASPAAGTKGGVEVLTDLARWEGKPADYRVKLLDIVDSWIDDADIHEHSRSILDIVEAALSRMGEETFMTGADSFTWRTFLIPPDAQEPVRDRAMSIVRRCSDDQDARVVLRAARVYLNLSKALFPIAARQSITDEQQRWWQPERVMAFGELERIVRSATEPLVHLEIIAEARSYLRHEKDPDIARAGSRLIDGVERTALHRMTAALVDSRGHRYKPAEQDEETPRDFERSWRKHLLAIRETAAWIVNTYTPADFVTIAGERLSAAKRLGIRSDPLVLLGEMGNCAPSFVKVVSAAVLETADHPLAESLATMIASVIASDLGTVLALAKWVSESPIKEIALGATAAIPGERPILEDERAIAKALWLHPIPEVRGTSIAMSRSFLKANRDFIEEVLPLVDLSEPITAKAFAETFGRHDLTLSLLNPELIQKMLTDFRSLPNLSDYRVADLVADAAEVLPVEVVEMLLGRISDVEDSDFHLDREAIPHAALHFDMSKLGDNAAYWEALRLIRDASLDESLRSWHLAGLFNAFTSVYDDRTLAFLDEWVRSGDAKKLQGVAKLVSQAPSDFVFEGKEWVIAFLNRACALGPECYDVVGGRLSTGAVTRMKHGNHGKPFPEDVELRERAAEVMKELQPNTPEWLFYNSLREHAEREVRWKIDRDAAADEAGG